MMTERSSSSSSIYLDENCVDGFSDEIDLFAGPTISDYLVASTLQFSKLDTLQKSHKEKPNRLCDDEVSSCSETTMVAPPNVMLKRLSKIKTSRYRQKRCQIIIIGITLALAACIVVAVLLTGQNKHEENSQSTSPELSKVHTKEFDDAVNTHDIYSHPTNRPVRRRRKI